MICRKSMGQRYVLHHSMERRLAMTLQMQKALAILEMPQLELAQFLQEEIEKNPLLEEIPLGHGKSPFPEVAAEVSLSEHLLRQIQENFNTKEDRDLACLLLDFLDEKGFLSESKEAIFKKMGARALEVLAKMQTFEPFGIFAENVQESFLIQLKMQGDENSSTFFLVQHFFDDFMHQRYRLLMSKMPHLDIGEAIHKLALLHLRPLSFFYKEQAVAIFPDLEISRKDKIVSMREDVCPKFRIPPTYEKLKKDASVRMWISHGKWLLNALSKRKKMLLEIGEFLLKYQAEFFSCEGNLKPLTLRALASVLGVHESTVSRAVADKYIKTENGIFPIKTFFSSSPEKKDIKKMVLEIVSQEIDSLTDEEIAKCLEKKGFCIARRTISKYRRELKIPSAAARKARRTIDRR